MDTIANACRLDWLDDVADVVHVRTMDGRLLYANKIARERFGWPECDGVEPVDAGDRGDFAEIIRQCEAAGNWSGNQERRDVHGNRVSLEARWSPIPACGTNGTAWFVYEINDAEGRLLDENRVRAQRLESIGTLAGGVAHDINNVLGPILIGAEMIRRRVDDPWILKKLGGIEASAQRGADDFLAKPFNATELCDAVRTQLAKKDRTSADQTLAHGRVDPFASSLLAAEIHDPVQTILSFTHILKRATEVTEPDELRHMARHLEGSALRIRKTVDNVLLYSELIALHGNPDSTVHLRSQTTPNVGRLVESRARAMAQVFGRESDLSVSVSSGNVAIGRTYMVRIIDELTSNAFMFSDAGTPVSVTAAFSKDRFGMSVKDKGRGMSPDQLGAMNAFMQFDRMESGQPGLGLGLAIVRRIVTLHDGALLIRSQLGETTRASVELPRRSHV